MSFSAIERHGKHAVGQHRFAIVDAGDHERLNRWRWKAKWNGAGNHLYAVRNTRIDGRNITLRMHREVMGIRPGDPRVVDHLNGNALDNRQVNLRIGTQAHNMRQAVVVTEAVACSGCGSVHYLANRLSILRRLQNLGWLCAACRAARNVKPRVAPALTMHACARCGDMFTVNTSRHRFCSDDCRLLALTERRRRGARAKRTPEPFSSRAPSPRNFTSANGS